MLLRYPYHLDFPGGPLPAGSDEAIYWLSAVFALIGLLRGSWGVGRAGERRAMHELKQSSDKDSTEDS